MTDARWKKRTIEQEPTNAAEVDARSTESTDTEAAEKARDATGVSHASLLRIGKAALAADIYATFAQSEWPAPLYPHCVSAAARQLDLAARLAYAAVGAEGVAAERILLPRLPAAVATMSALEPRASPPRPSRARACKRCCQLR